MTEYTYVGVIERYDSDDLTLRLRVGDTHSSWKEFKCTPGMFANLAYHFPVGSRIELETNPNWFVVSVVRQKES